MRSSSATPTPTSEGAAAIEALVRVNRDLTAAATLLTAAQARYLVDFYYTWQDNRIRAAGQARADAKSGEPNAVVTWALENFAVMERDIQRALNAYSRSTEPGRWLRSIVGIGPVMASGFLAHIDITKAPTAGHIWRFAGLDPTVVWAPKTRRPWNAALKRLSWLAGESFVKVSNRPGDVYGQVYVGRKALEVERNEAGLFAQQAADILEKRRIGHETDAYAAYSAGKLPPAHVHARAKRYAVKLFLAHLQHVLYEEEYHTAPPRPYVLDHIPGHVHYIAPPNWPIAVEKMGRGESGGGGSADGQEGEDTDAVGGEESSDLA